MEALAATQPAADAFDRYRAVRVFRAVLRAVDWVAEKAVIAIMAVMLTIVSAQVFMRYMMNRSLDWADETATLCFVWTVFLAIPLALRNGGHIVMEMLLIRLSDRVRDGLYRAMGAFSLVMLLMIAREAFVLARDNWDEVIPVLNLSGGLFYVAVAIGAAHTGLRTVEILMTGEPRVKTGIIE